jgi:apolipoprotein N-acyltransferase
MRDAFRCTRIAVAAPVLLILLGSVMRAGDHAVAPLRPLHVAVVQAEIASRDVWDPARRTAHWNAYLSATESLKPGAADLVVWPQSAAPFLLDADSAAKATLADLATRLGAAILLGAPRSQATGEGRAALFDSVYFFAPGEAQPLTYDRQRLLPFVERMPIALGDAPQAADYRAGTATESFDVGGWRIAPLVCFEAVYPQYAREAVLRGAHLLVNLSNDAWLAGGAGAEQHYAMSILRTVELRRPMVRASNGGISGAIGEDGEAIGFPIRHQQAVRVYEIPPPSRTMTLAATHPDMVLWLSGLIAAIALAAALWPASIGE